jgi:hypothetical protein
MGLMILFAFALAIGFGAGRVHHPANFKLAAIKAEIAKIESEASVCIIADYREVVTRVKSLL